VVKIKIVNHWAIWIF